MTYKNDLLDSLDKLKTTDLGKVRIKRNLDLNVDDVVEWCQEKAADEAATIIRCGKNWYVRIEDIEICINASSYTIITAHKIKVKEVI